MRFLPAQVFKAPEIDRNRLENQADAA